MIEIFVLRAFYRRLAEMAQSKNRSASWGWLGVILWIAGEITGFLVAADSTPGGGYVAALGCALAGAVIAFVTVSALSSVPPADFPTASIHREH